MNEVNLGVTQEEKNKARDTGDGYDSPTLSMAQGGPGMDKVVYPHFHYCGPVDLELPDDGEMTIRFVKQNETSSIDKNGKHWYECKVEVLAIKDVDGEGPPDAHIPAPTKSYDDASGALDKIRAELESKPDDDDDAEGY